MSKIPNLYTPIDSEHPWVWTIGNQPLIATAIHDGHAVRQEVAAHFALEWSDRRREEDPFTAQWTQIADTRLIVQRSRFEVDLNRSRENAPAGPAYSPANASHPRNDGPT